MPTDSERLDFLEKTLQPLFTVYDGRDRKFVGWCVGYSPGEHASAREAIDAAMRLYSESVSGILANKDLNGPENGRHEGSSPHD